MAPVVHKVIDQKELSQNYPPYRHYIKCQCGFEARLPTKVAVESQFDAHLLYHGQEPFFAGRKEELKKEEPKENGTSSTPAPSGDVKASGQVKST